VVRERAADGATAPVGVEHHEVGWLLVRLRRPAFALTRKPMAEDLHSKIPGSKPVVVPGVGHLSNAKAAERFDAKLRSLVRSVQNWRRTRGRLAWPLRDYASLEYASNFRGDQEKQPSPR